MKLGLLARSEDRGLGLQSWEFCRHLPVDKVLIVDMGELAGGFKRHDERYIHALATRGRGEVSVATYYNGFFADEAAVRGWLCDLDVVFSVETLYDPRFHLWAREAGVATVIQLNPEFIKPDLFEPTVWWAPTSWRRDELNVESTLVPVPVALDRFTYFDEAPDGAPLRVLHVVGHRAASDRNGTQLFQQSIRYLHYPIQARVITQDTRLIPFRRHGASPTEVIFGGVDDYWNLYRNADVLALPRRYGGLSLVAQEAAGASLALVMTDCPPNDTWPAARIPARPKGFLRAPAGNLQLWEASPRALAVILDELSCDRVRLKDLRRQARDWAEAHSWERLTPLYLQELTRATDLARRQ